jgi:hypothetical protein
MSVLVATVQDFRDALYRCLRRGDLFGLAHVSCVADILDTDQTDENGSFSSLSNVVEISPLRACSAASPPA